MTRPLEATCNPQDDFSATTSYSSLEEIWAAEPEQRGACRIAEIPTTTWLDIEDQAIEHTYGNHSNSLHILYQICAEPLLGDQEAKLPYSDEQRHEVEGALIVCPSHPDADEIRGRMDAVAEKDQLRTEGLVFAGGTYRVGEDVQPGTYVSETTDDEPFDGCYWELLDESGEIIDNNFVSEAFRIEIAVPESAYSLHVDGCGEFSPVE